MTALTTPLGNARTALTLEDLLHRCSSLPPLLSVQQTADLLGLSRSAAYRAVDRGELPVIRLSGRIRIPAIQLLTLMGLSIPDLDHSETTPTR